MENNPDKDLNLTSASLSEGEFRRESRMTESDKVDFNGERWSDGSKKRNEEAAPRELSPKEKTMKMLSQYYFTFWKQTGVFGKSKKNFIAVLDAMLKQMENASEGHMKPRAALGYAKKVNALLAKFIQAQVKKGVFSAINFSGRRMNGKSFVENNFEIVSGKKTLVKNVNGKIKKGDSEAVVTTINSLIEAWKEYFENLNLAVEQGGE